MKLLAQIAMAVPGTLDRRLTTGWIGLYLALFVVLILLPTGILFENEEYYFQVAAQFWAGNPPSPFSALMETSPHLFLSSLLIGLPVHWFGYEIANAILRIGTALALAFSFARLVSVWRLSALDAVVGLSIFVLLEQQYFGGEWIIRGVEGKVFAYVFVFLGLASAFSDRWKSCVFFLVVATWFHFLVGGFWMLAALVWFLQSGQRAPIVLRALLIYLAAVLPLAALIGWQRLAGSSQDPAIDTWHAFAVLRMAHHIAPFSSKALAWSWTPGVVLLLSTLWASILALQIKVEPRTSRLLRLLIGLQVYLLLALLASTTDTGVRLLGEFFPFRPSSLTLLLAIGAMFILYRQYESNRLTVWLAAWLLVPAMTWGVVKDKVEEVVRRPVDPAELSALVEAVARSTGAGEVVLVQPGRDSESPEAQFSRALRRPTLVNWDFAPTVPETIEKWVRRQEFRVAVFENGCNREEKYPVGALIVYNPDRPAESVIDSCGEIVWSGRNYSVVDIIR